MLEEIIQDLDALGYDFYDAKNEIDFTEVKEGAVIALDELEDIVERDEAYRDAMSNE